MRLPAGTLALDVSPFLPVKLVDARLGEHRYGGRTEKAWASTCGCFVLKLVDGSEHIASFSFSE